MTLDALFGPTTPLALRFGIAFLAVLVLIGVMAFVLRRFASRGQLGQPGGRGANRLGVLESFQIDAQRRLVILRRDAVEHLVMIGGPNDVVIEANIVRGQAANGASSARDERAASAPTAIPATESARRAPAPRVVAIAHHPPEVPPTPSAELAPAPPPAPVPAAAEPPRAPTSQDIVEPAAVAAAPARPAPAKAEQDLGALLERIRTLTPR